MPAIVNKMLGADNKITIEILNGYIAEGSIFMSPSAETTVMSEVPNITRELIEEFAKDEELKTEEVFYVPLIKRITSLMQEPY